MSGKRAPVVREDRPRGTLDALKMRQTLGRSAWSIPQPYGPDGWFLTNRHETGQVIVSVAAFDDVDWIHASIAFRARLPRWDELGLLHRAVFRDGYAYQAFVPADQHVNIHVHALHLWGRADGQPELPLFGDGGQI